MGVFFYANSLGCIHSGFFIFLSMLYIEFFFLKNMDSKPVFLSSLSTSVTPGRIFCLHSSCSLIFKMGVITVLAPRAVFKTQ